MASAKPRKSHHIAANPYIQAATAIFCTLPVDASESRPAGVFMDESGTLFVEVLSETIRFQEGSVFVATIAPVKSMMSKTRAPVRDFMLASERIDRLAARIRHVETDSGRKDAF